MFNAREYYLLGCYVVPNAWKYNYNLNIKHHSSNFSINTNVHGGITGQD
jgi:hypothetical protein